MSPADNKNNSSHGKANENKVKKNHKSNKRERKMKKKDFIKRNILVRIHSDESDYLNRMIQPDVV